MSVDSFSAIKSLRVKLNIRILLLFSEREFLYVWYVATISASSEHVDNPGSQLALRNRKRKFNLNVTAMRRRRFCAYDAEKYAITFTLRLSKFVLTLPSVRGQGYLIFNTLFDWLHTI